MQPVIDDQRLLPILDKVQRGERLRSSTTASPCSARRTCSRSATWPTSCANGCTATSRSSTSTATSIPTDVCVASCKLCAFGKKAKDPKAYTHVAREIWERAGEGYIGGDHRVSHRRRAASGTHRRLVLRDAARPEAALSAGASEGVHDGGDRLLRRALQDCPYEEVLQQLQGCRHGFDARRRRRDLHRARAAHHLRPQDRRRRVAGDRAHGAQDGPEEQLHDALRPHRKRRRPRRSSDEAARRAGRDERVSSPYIPLAFHPDNTPLEHVAEDHGLRRS